MITVSTEFSGPTKHALDKRRRLAISYGAPMEWRGANDLIALRQAEWKPLRSIDMHIPKLFFVQARVRVGKSWHVSDIGVYEEDWFG